MDFITLARILVRRWYVVLPGVAITVYIGVSLVDQVEPQYDAEASAVLYLRDDRAGPGAEPGPRNPLAGTSQALMTMAAIVDEVLSASAYQARLGQAGLSSDYDVGLAEESPILTLTATAGTRRLAIATANGLLDEVDAVLESQQDGVAASPEVRVESQVLRRAEDASVVTVARNRAIVSISVAGVLAVVGLTLLAESIGNARRRRSEPAPGEPGPDPVQPADGNRVRIQGGRADKADSTTAHSASDPAAAGR